jgi:cytidylate kinase
MNGFVIAIDGPAASGKSSTASAVARALDYVHLDSGALYRALTWVASADQVVDAEAILHAAVARQVDLRVRRGEVVVHVDGVDDVDAAIRSAAVNASVSTIAAMPEVRDWVNARIRSVVATLPGAVIDGRDIGTVVVPDAPVKVFLTATAEARTRRRLMQRGVAVDATELAAETSLLARRDHLDQSRAVAPLRQAADAVLVDTTDLTFAAQVAAIVELARARQRS